MSLFIEQHVSTNPAIILWDASGSIKHNFNNDMSVLNKMTEVVSDTNIIKSSKCRCIFWNSDNATNVNFTKGTLKIPYVVDCVKINQLITGLIEPKIQCTCLTYPHLAFEELIKSPEWFDQTKLTHIYFVTDGQIGYQQCSSFDLANLKNKLMTSIVNLFEKYANVFLHILTIESTNHDFDKFESLNIAAGGDVFKLIQSNGLTKYITEFVSYTPTNPNGFIHINNLIAPPGYLAFGTKLFPELKMGEFIIWLQNEITNICANSSANSTTIECDLLRYIQQLTPLLKTLTNDKPNHMIDQILDRFVQLFEFTPIDPAMVRFIINDSIKLEIEGKGIIFSQYRSKLKDLYKQANDLLMQNTSNAIGMSSQKFITLPINNIIISGSSQLVNQTINLLGQNLPNAGIQIDHLIIPALPFKTNLSPLNEQCLRQYIRLCIASLYNVDKMGDIVIYIVMALNAKVSISNVSNEIKNIYKNIVTVMLKKKRLNSDQTELDRLINGDIPMPNNGRIELFYQYMEQIKSIFELNNSTNPIKPMFIWYMLIQALDNELLCTRQFVHCIDDLNSGLDPNISTTASSKIPNLSQILLQTTNFVNYDIPSEYFLDYKCLITLNDCSIEGGFKISSHITSNNSTCCPNNVFSASGYKDMLAQTEVFCPICWTKLTDDSFEQVGPKINTLNIIFSSDIINPFNKKTESKFNSTKSKFNSTKSDSIKSDSIKSDSIESDLIESKSKSKSKSKSNNECRKILIKLKGPVGAGKTTYASELERLIITKGGICINEGTDKYCRTGLSTKQAVAEVSKKFAQIKSIKKSLIVVIVDTCGERDTNNIFGYDFICWEKYVLWPNKKLDFDENMHMKFLKWSLANVLNRQMYDYSTPYYLTPVSAGVDVCVRVHNDKTRLLFGSCPLIVNGSKETILNLINSDVNEYQEWLNTNMDLKQTISEFVEQTLGLI